MWSNEMNNSDNSVIRIENLSKYYGSFHAIKDVSLDVHKGETHVICGPSGSGKSTMLFCINGLEKYQSGHVYFNGDLMTPKNIRHMRTKIGMVFQHFELFPHLTALQNVTIAPIKIQKRDREEAEDNARSLFKKVGLENRMDHFPYQLSGGQKQRIAILRALAMDPDIVLFDEPTSALDPEMVKDVLYVMKDLSTSGMTMIVVTHELGFAKEVASHITFFEDGQIIETKSPDEFFRGNGSERTKIFLNNIINV